MLTILSFIISVVFFLLAIVHFNWFLGGAWGFDVALPTNEEGKKVLNPKKIDSLIVGLGLFVFGFFFLIKGNIVKFNLPSWMVNYTGWIIVSIFLLRAIGDFKYVGFFKNIKNTKFGKADTNYFSPLCLILALIGVLIELLN